MKRLRRKRALAVETLENRYLLSVGGFASGSGFFDPSSLEQEMFEHVNRMRLNPEGELDVLFSSFDPLTARDPDAQLAVTVFGDPTAEEILADWSALSPVAALAWNVSLYEAALGHTNLMVEHDDQSHRLPGEAPLGERIAAAGYEGGAVGENVYAYMNSVFHGHSAFSIDWGVPDRSHRNNMMASTFREIGISIVGEENAATEVGPLLVTQDFGDGYSLDAAYLLGVVWDDGNGNGWYDAGEGFGNVDLLIEGEGVTYTASSMTAGGYQTLLEPGVYTITAHGGSLPTPMVVRDVVVDDDNVKVDFKYDPYANLPPLVDLNGPGEASVNYQTTYFEGWPSVPIVAVDAFLEDTNDEQIVSLTVTITNPMEPEEYLVVDTTGTPIDAGFDAPASILTLSGAASVADYTQVLRTLGYGHAGMNPNETPRVIEIVAFDGVEYSATATATVGIVHTDPPELSINDLRVEEAGGETTTYAFTVELSSAVNRTVTVNFATQDGSALAGLDFAAAAATLQFAPGQTTRTVSLALIDDDVVEDDEVFLAQLSSPVGATIADAIGVATIIDDDMAVKLGSVDFLGMEGIDLAIESPLYRFSTSREGNLSIDVRGAADGVVMLTLLDQCRSAEAVATGVSSGGHARIDRPWAPAGETYYLEVSGNGEVDLLMGTVVRQEDSLLIVEGTDGDDIFEYTAGDMLAFSVNGLAYSYTWDEASSLRFDGGDGEDQARLTGSGADDVATLSPGGGVLQSGQYDATVEGTEVIEVHGGGGTDSVSLYDSAGPDTLVAGVDSATLTGEGFANTASGFAEVLGYSTAGGADTAQLIGGEGNEEFIGKPELGKLVGADYYVRTKQFSQVVVVSGGGVDSARVYGDTGAERFVAGPGVSELTAEGYHYRMEDYPYVHGYSRGGTGDTALLTDSDGDDTLVATPLYAKLIGEAYVVRAKFFPTVKIDASGAGNDSARLYDSEGDDAVVLGLTESRSAGDGFDHRLSGFEQVTAYSEAGDDTATFHDTPGDDAFVSQVGEALLVGIGYVAKSVGFTSVYAYAVAGGFDTATIHDTAGDDQLVSQPSFTWLSGAEYFVRAKLFETVHVYSVAGGHDMARFGCGAEDAVFTGTPTLSTMVEGVTVRRVEAFEEVYAEAGGGVDTAVLEGSTREDDLVESGEDFVRVSNDVLNFLVEARRFEEWGQAE